MKAPDTISVCLILAFISIITGCKKKDVVEDTRWTYEISKTKHSFIASYNILLKRQTNSVELLGDRSGDFYNNPSITKYNQLRSTWITSFHDFNVVKPLFYMDFTLNPFQFEMNNVALSNLDESYIDYTNSTPGSGIIFDEITYPLISIQEIDSWHLYNTPGNENKITLGFHVLEFLLWGEDLNTLGSGERPQSDYVSTSTTNDRRRRFLQSAGIRLKQELINKNWNQAFTNNILAMGSKSFMDFTLSGMIKFIKEDFANQTILKPYTSQNIDDELSRFSDNTINDIKSKLDAVSLFIDGRGLFENHNDFFMGDLLKQVDEARYESLLLILDKTYEKLNSVSTSFDVALTSAERPKINEIYVYLTEISSLLEDYKSVFDTKL